MEIGSHYYAVLALSRMLGIKKDIAYRIAYSSQFVDDALIRRIIFKKVPKGVKCHIFGRRRGLDHTATCPKIMTVWSYNRVHIIHTFAPFHFVPGCKGSYFDKKMRTFPQSPILKSLEERAVHSGDPYAMGIVLHALGDAHAHQGFSSLVSRRNRVKKLKIDRSTVPGVMDSIIAWYMAYAEWLFSRIFGRILPLYSHSHVGTVPDIPSAKWSYEYDRGTSLLPEFKSSGPISNPDRYRIAFEEMRELLIRFIDLNPDIREDVPIVPDEVFYEQLSKPLSRRESIVDWESFLEKHRLLDAEDTALHYHPRDWLKNAFADYTKRKYSKTLIAAALPVEDFAKTDWYRYYQAARDYKEHYDLLIIQQRIY